MAAVFSPRRCPTILLHLGFGELCDDSLTISIRVHRLVVNKSTRSKFETIQLPSVGSV